MSAKAEAAESASGALPLRVLIVYYSRFGAIRELASAIAGGVATIPDATADLLEVDDAPVSALQGEGPRDEGMQATRTALLGRVARADALIVGGPAYFGSLASPVKRFFEDLAVASSPHLDRTRPWHHYLFRDKPGAAFISSATPHGGNEQALQSTLTMLMHLGMIIVTPGQRGPILEQPDAPYGATAITGSSGNRGPTEGETAEARALGRRVAEVAAWLRAGRTLANAQIHGLATTGSPQFDPSA